MTSTRGVPVRQNRANGGFSAQDELDLAVQAAQIVVRPALERFQQGRIDTKEKRLALSHETY
jgi:hypothetical protein